MGACAKHNYYFGDPALMLWKVVASIPFLKFYCPVTFKDRSRSLLIEGVFKGPGLQVIIYMYVVAWWWLATCAAVA